MKLLLWLGVMLAGTLLASRVEPCEIPPEYIHRTTVLENDLVITLATDKASYFAGDPVDFYIGVLNTGPDTINVLGPDPMNIFTVTSDTCLSLNEDCIDASLYFYPPIVYFFGDAIHLLPGECETRSDHWDGLVRTWDGEKVVVMLPPPGEYKVHAGFYHLVAAPQLVDFVIPDNGIILPISISLVTSVGPEHQGNRNTVLSVFPNPTSAGSRILFNLPERGTNANKPYLVQVEVFHVSGRLMKRLDPVHLPSGNHWINWDGSTQTGSLAKNGIYFVRLNVDGQSVGTAKVVRLR